jgi:DNA polymerase-3 subunit beta
MKFVVYSATLLRTLNALKSVIPSNPLLNIAENFLFEINNGILTVTATDMQVVMISDLQVEANENAAIAIPAKILLETVKNLPEQPITFSIDVANNTIEIQSSNGRYKISGEVAEDFPTIETIKSDLTVRFETGTIASALAYTLFAVSTDELRPQMNGVYFDFKPDYLNVVATDGHRLVRYQRTDIRAEQERGFLIPTKALEILKAALPSENMMLEVQFNSRNAFFTFGSTRMICRLLDERFPDYENVLPLNNDKNLIVERAATLSSLKRLLIYANKVTNQVRLSLRPDTLIITSEDPDFSNEASETHTCDYSNEDFDIGFNAKWLSEMFANLASSKVRFQFSYPGKAALLRPEESMPNEDILMLLMPIMLHSY